MKIPWKYFLRRILVYVLGLLFLAFGVAFSVNSNMGVSPVNSLPYVVSLVSGINMGTCVIGIFSFYILVQIVLLRKNFRWINLTQLIFSTIFGYFVDFSKWAVGDLTFPGYGGQLLMLFFSIILVSTGVCLYMDAELVNMPMEGMTYAVKEILFPRKPFPEVKVLMDCLVVGIGLVVLFLAYGKLEGIREGTILSAVLVGKMMKPLQKILKPRISRFCFGKGDTK